MIRDFSLQAITFQDQERLLKLMQKIYPTAYAHFWQESTDWYLDLCYNPQNLKKELAEKSTNYFLVVQENREVGILKYDYPSSPSQIEIKNAVKLHRLYLAPETHGSGLAKALMEHVEEDSAAKGADRIWLEVMQKSDQAQKFYSKMGYEKVLEYRLDFEKLKPEYRGIEIWNKDIG
ncbi:GNAT family N-acetyltransferase [Algoriphagus sediminis]|uniref:GNAT family N-acetyltransferase n=1 Tax=Algoriphagus sediminis TaxID=3057113 RepID=A0ABT7YAK6_9BACT|nr:GNAT family N-acetyltransferase [Algoriphagus sediminis]MDN3203471.1 GNAT family N-acetyltransferase [Algoriphagus sediminis]